MAVLRAKSLALSDLFITLFEERCSGHELELVTPLAHAVRGSQVSLARTTGAYGIMQALIARGVIGDFRAGADAATGKSRDADILRFGLTPLYLGFTDVWQAVEHLCQVMDSGEWREDRFNQKHAVT